MFLRICGTLKSARVRKSQIRKLPHVRKVRNSKIMKSARLRIGDFWNLFADRPWAHIYTVKSISKPALILCF
jgi:hypothetical protein